MEEPSFNPGCDMSMSSKPPYDYGCTLKLWGGSAMSVDGLKQKWLTSLPSDPLLFFETILATRGYIYGPISFFYRVPFDHTHQTYLNHPNILARSHSKPLTKQSNHHVEKSRHSLSHFAFHRGLVQHANRIPRRHPSSLG